MSEPEMPFSEFYINSQRAAAATDMRRDLTTKMDCGHFKANLIETHQKIAGVRQTQCVSCKREESARVEARQQVREELRSVLRHLFNLAGFDLEPTRGSD